MKSPRPNRNDAFTLIEMIVALVLASLMMTGLLRIVSLVSIESNQLRGEHTDYVAAGMLADRMRADLINARGILASRESVDLAGYVTPLHLPGSIRYERQTIDSTQALVRRAGSQSEICWISFGGFEFESYEEINDETPVPEMTGGLPAIPSRFRIAAYDANGRVLFSQVIQHHAD